MLLAEGIEDNEPELNGLPYVDQQMPDGTVERRYLARLAPPDGHPMMALPGWEATTGITPIARSEWAHYAFEARHGSVPILNQNGRGACVGHAWATAVMIQRDRSGAPFVELSAFHLYTLINHGVDAGANSADAVQALMSVGIAPKSMVQGTPVRPYGYSSEAMAAAARFKLRQAIPIRSLDEAFTAVVMGYMLTFDVQAGGGYTTDSSGTVRYLGGRTNHEQCCGEGIRFDRQGNPQFLGRNSWSEHWGMNGFGWFTHQHIEASDMTYAVQYMVEDPQDPNMPPALP